LVVLVVAKIFAFPATSLMSRRSRNI